MHHVQMRGKVCYARGLQVPKVRMPQQDTASACSVIQRMHPSIVSSTRCIGTCTRDAAVLHVIRMFLEIIYSMYELYMCCLMLAFIMTLETRKTLHLTHARHESNIV